MDEYRNVIKLKLFLHHESVQLKWRMIVQKIKQLSQ